MRERLLSELKSILSGMEIKKHAIEGELAIALCLCRMHKLRVYIYGAGKDVFSFVKFLLSEQVDLAGIVDRNEKLSGEKIFGVPIMMPDKFVSGSTDRGDVFVFIWTSFFSGIQASDIVKVMNDANAPYFYHVGPSEKKQITNVTTDWVDANRMKYYISHSDNIVQLAESLCDDESVKTLNEYIKIYMQCSVYGRKQIHSRYKYFYDNGGREIYQHLKDEVWLNAGAYTGDNIFYYEELGLSAKKIYAIEGDAGIAGSLRRNLSMLPVKDKVEVLNVFIDDRTDFDGILGGERITLVNADIEGHEISLLKALEKRIVRDRPVIAVCAYHKKEDLVEIPKYLSEICIDYRYCLRKYFSAFVHRCQGGELVFYAVPNERTSRQHEPN